MTRPSVGDPADRMRPILLTDDEVASLRSLLRVVAMSENGVAGSANALIAAIESREVEGPHYEYVLAGPWGTIGEGDRSLEATIAGCRDARRQHWEQGHGRDERYDQIQVLRYASYYATDADGEEIGRFQGAEIVVPVEDAPLTDEEQAESARRIKDAAQSRQLLYAHLREIQKRA